MINMKVNITYELQKQQIFLKIHFGIYKTKRVILSDFIHIKFFLNIHRLYNISTVLRFKKSVWYCIIYELHIMYFYTVLVTFIYKYDRLKIYTSVL